MTEAARYKVPEGSEPIVKVADDAHPAPEGAPVPVPHPTPESTPTPAAGTPHPVEPVLTARVLALLGDVAAAEQQPREARHWYRRALDTPDDDQAHDHARTALETHPAAP
ncbi:hypothetical protein ABTZ59_30780 [Streptomyces sp. NPDC094034]|uniref:hypothetical protein n=1 Tax=Streptomyces sp. NPDC094034 TaxID=3155309 RepID=UPI003328F01A